jgi:hypothetical protein
MYRWQYIECSLTCCVYDPQCSILADGAQSPRCQASWDVYIPGICVIVCQVYIDILISTQSRALQRQPV